MRDPQATAYVELMSKAKDLWPLLPLSRLATMEKMLGSEDFEGLNGPQETVYGLLCPMCHVKLKHEDGFGYGYCPSCGDRVVGETEDEFEKNGGN